MFDVITIGTATRDVFVESDLFKIVKDASHLKRIGFPTGEAQCFALGGKIEIGRPAFAFGGGAANAAVTFHREGFLVAAVAKIGDDENGDAVVANLKRHNIVPYLARDKTEGTAYSVVLLSPTGERTVLDYRGASKNLTLSEVPFVKLNAKVAYIVPGRIAFSVMHGIIKALKKKGVFIVMNPSAHYLELGPARLASMFRMVDVITLNREEAVYVTGGKYEHKDKLFKKFEKLFSGIAVITDGPNGVYVSNGKKIYSAGVFKEKKIVNRIGAGDAFGSGFVAGLLRYGDLSKNASDEAIMYAMRLASANATSVVEHMGAQIGVLTRSEFEGQTRWKNFKISIRTL